MGQERKPHSNRNLLKISKRFQLQDINRIYIRIYNLKIHIDKERNIVHIKWYRHTIMFHLIVIKS